MKSKKMGIYLRLNNGYTLVEVIIVVIIMGIIASIAMKSLSTATYIVRTEETKKELEQLGFAISGNPAMASGGIRTDFGYVGDVGALPPNLDALVVNPGGYSTWNGPYVRDEFSDGLTNSEFKLDGWGKQYSYSAGNTISSSGGGSAITFTYANSTADLLYNTVSISVIDLDYTPPGVVYKDSILAFLTYPDGAGALVADTKNPNSNGLVVFDSIPIGIHRLRVVFIPDSDTLTRNVSVNPGQNSYSEIQHFADVW